MEYKNVDEVLNKLILSYSSIVGLISRAMEHDKIGGNKDMGLTKAQFSLLQLINSLEKVTVSTLVAVTGTSKSSTSIMLTKMENDGYIKRVPAEGDDDKRKVYIVLTEKGESVYKTSTDNFIDKFNEFYGSLSAENKILFGNIIENSYKLFVENREEIK
ncbi:MAG: MarR family transcriptional regulator [Firmicutes bacterium]|nr:MarR family transcriptional regulator [Bacillota bacterium]